MSGTAPGVDGTDGRDLARWALSFALIVALHGAALAGLVAARNLPADQGEALPAVMVDMAPPPAAPTVAAADLPPAEASPEAATLDAVPDAPADMPVPPPETPRPIVTADVPPPPETLPDVPKVDVPTPPTPVVAQKAEVALPPPVPTPKPAPPKPKERVVDRRPPTPVRATPPRAKRAERQDAERPPAQASGARSAAAVASLSSGASAASRSSWQGALVAALNRAKRPQGETGSASVRFSIDRGGRLLSANLAGSAGIGSLDQEAVALVRRASLPPAPSDVLGATFTFTIPIRFTIR